MAECNLLSLRRTPAVWLMLLICSVGSAADDLSGQQREKMYAELIRDVTAFEQQGNLLKRVVRLVKPTIVHIAARRRTRSDPDYARRALEEAGSGVIVDIRGRPYVLTNRHVVHESSLSSIDIRLAGGDLLHPTYVWTDAETDVAVMQVGRAGLTTARIGDSDGVEIGDFVLAVGSPFGLSHSVTYGIISAKGRHDLELGDGSIRYQDFIQTDAAINPGNSGGPLLNLRGEVIGINTAIASNSGGNEGIGFAMPVDMAMAVAGQLVEHGRVLRAYLGVRLNPSFEQREARRLGLARPTGAHVTSVTPNSPAERADLRTDDVIIRFDGHQIEDDDHLIRLVGFTQIGKAVEVVVLRGRRRLSLRVSVADRHDFDE